MIRQVLRFLLVWPEGVADREGQAWVKQREAAFGPLLDEKTAAGMCGVVLAPQRIPELLKYFQDWRREGGRINCFGIDEELVEDDQTSVEWFTVDPTYRGAFKSLYWDLQEPVERLDDHLSVKADRMKRGVHLAGGFTVVYVSDRFEALVEKHRLSGIDFIWCRDVGKYQAPQWYFPVCARPLGRGLDDPRIDITKLSGRGFQTLDPRGRHGQHSAFEEQYKRDAGPSDPLLEELLALMCSMELLKRPGRIVATFPSYLLEYLPDTDFAYTVLDMGDGEGGNSRHRGLAMNRKARDLLKAHGIVTHEHCKPVMILDRPLKGAEDLDRRYGPPEPPFSAEQLAGIRELESRAWAEHVAHPKPPPAPNLARALALLRSWKRRAPESFAKPATPKALAEAATALGLEIPAAWQKVLRISNGGRIDNSPLADDQACFILPVEKLAKSRQTEAAYYRDIHAELSHAMLPVVRTEIGDSIWLDTSQQRPDGDARVVLMSHETGGEEREWSSVAYFLEEFLAPEDD
jgi:hypothetical protein